jgi:transcriptional regulator with XRE-family HTH domain
VHGQSRFSSLLVLSRLKKQLLQKQVASRAGVHPSYLAGIECGRRPAPKPELLSRILDGLELTQKDREKLEEAAAWDQLSTILSRSERKLRGVSLLHQMSLVLPDSTDMQIAALESLIRAMFCKDNM